MNRGSELTPLFINTSLMAIAWISWIIGYGEASRVRDLMRAVNTIIVMLLQNVCSNADDFTPLEGLKVLNWVMA